MLLIKVPAKQCAADTPKDCPGSSATDCVSNQRTPNTTADCADSAVPTPAALAIIVPMVAVVVVALRLQG